MTGLDFSRFEALSFDCYGTLIDWETGILAALRPILQEHRIEAADEKLLESYARNEAGVEAGPYRRYREVLAQTLRGISADFGFEPGAAELAAFAASVGDWPPFSDSSEALRRLGQRFGLGVLTNCDDDLFAASQRRLGVEFDWVVTAEQAGSYKPSEANFELLLATLALPRERILHVAQSLFHDHVPAKRLGMSTVWIDRRSGKSGSGATPPADVQPDLVLNDMSSLAAAALERGQA
jgi:2-haloacid dehalogenase